MTDEEKADKHAEEYVMREDVITENDRVPFDNGYGFQTVSFEDEVKKGYKEGFLAGLKAGRPQWHDLRKDQNDLPKKNKSYWVYIDCQGNKIYRSIVWQGCWIGVWDCIALAWCEIPTFDKE